MRPGNGSGGRKRWAKTNENYSVDFVEDKEVESEVQGEEEVSKKEEEGGEEEEEEDPKNLFHIRAKFLKLAGALQLPGNPLDTLIDQLGERSSSMCAVAFASTCA